VSSTNVAIIGAGPIGLELAVAFKRRGIHYVHLEAGQVGQTMQTHVPGLDIAGTATGGTRSELRVFVEDCHIHVPRIVAALTGEPPPPQTPETAAVLQMPES